MVKIKIKQWTINDSKSTAKQKVDLITSWNKK